MPIIQPDLSEVTSGKIEVGTYPAKILDVEAKTSTKGNPMIVVSFEVTVDGKKMPRKSWLVVTGAGAYGFDNLLRSTGFVDVADRLKAGERVPFDTDQLKGQELCVIIGEEEYNGEMRDKIDRYLPA